MKRYFCMMLFPLIFLIGCAAPPVVSVKLHKPAQIHLPGVKEIAIADFQGSEGSGNQIATLVQSILITTEYYDIVERDKLSRVMEEQNLGMAGIVDETTAVQVGKLLGVDAMIFGEVSRYEVERDERGVEKISKKVGTGKYEYVEVEKKGKKEKERREIMQTVFVDQFYRIRRGSVAVNFRVVGIEDGRLLAAYSDSKSYTSDKVIEGGSKTLLPEGEILYNLSKDLCQNFVRMISPYFEIEKRVLEQGKGPISVGVKYAQSDLWPEAMGAWDAAVHELPKESAGYYNLGIGYEVQGLLDEAEQSYQTASKLKVKKLYMDAIARIRITRNDQRRLRQQLESRENNP